MASGPPACQVPLALHRKVRRAFCALCNGRPAHIRNSLIADGATQHAITIAADEWLHKILVPTWCRSGGLQATCRKPPVDALAEH